MKMLWFSSWSRCDRCDVIDLGRSYTIGPVISQSPRRKHQTGNSKSQTPSSREILRLQTPGTSSHEDTTSKSSLSEVKNLRLFALSADFFARVIGDVSASLNMTKAKIARPRLTLELEISLGFWDLGFSERSVLPRPTGAITVSHGCNSCHRLRFQDRG